MQEKFIHTFFKKYGFTAQSLPVLVHGVQSMQNLKPAKEFRTLIANEESLDALLEIKEHLEYYLAVFALGLEGPKWWRLVCDYMDRCDDEHSSLQEKFIHTFFKQYGFTAQSLPVLVHGVQSMQNLEPAKEFCTCLLYTSAYADKQELEESIIRRHYGTVAEEEPPQDVPAAVGGMNHGMQAEKNSRKTILRP